MPSAAGGRRGTGWAQSVLRARGWPVRPEVHPVRVLLVRQAFARLLAVVPGAVSAAGENSCMCKHPVVDAGPFGVADTSSAAGERLHWHWAAAPGGDGDALAVVVGAEVGGLGAVDGAATDEHLAEVALTGTGSLPAPSARIVHRRVGDGVAADVHDDPLSATLSPCDDGIDGGWIIRERTSCPLGERVSPTNIRKLTSDSPEPSRYLESGTDLVIPVGRERTGCVAVHGHDVGQRLGQHPLGGTATGDATEERCHLVLRCRGQVGEVSPERFDRQHRSPPVLPPRAPDGSRPAMHCRSVGDAPPLPTRSAEAPDRAARARPQSRPAKARRPTAWRRHQPQLPSTGIPGSAISVRSTATTLAPHRARSRSAVREPSHDGSARTNRRSCPRPLRSDPPSTPHRSRLIQGSTGPTRRATSTGWTSLRRTAAPAASAA